MSLPTLSGVGRLKGAKICSITDCGRDVGPKGAKGLCSRHYQRMLSTGSPTGSSRPSASDRFFAKVEQRGECWVWTASMDDSGYGLFSDRTGKRKGSVRAHIWAFEHFIGPVPAGLQLDHLCHHRGCALGVDCPHRRCVNPWHLDPVPTAVNSARGRGARRSHCPQGHPYDLGNTYLNPKGAQVCRTCMAASRDRYEAKKAVAA